MSHDALRTILPVAGLDPERARTVEFTGGSDPILPTSFKIGETSAACLGAIGLAVSDLWKLRGHKEQGDRGRRAPRDGVAAQRPLPQNGKGRGIARAQPGDGHVPGEERPLELHPRQFPQPPRRRAQGAGRARGQGGGAPGGRQMGRARTGRGDHRRQGRRRHGAHHGRMGATPAGEGAGDAAAAQEICSRSATRRSRSCPDGDWGRFPASGCST